MERSFGKPYKVDKKIISYENTSITIFTNFPSYHTFLVILITLVAFIFVVAFIFTGT